MGINEIIKIGDRLKTLRLSKGLTQAQVAEKIGIPRTTYANYESDKREPKIDILNKIAAEFDVTIDDILTKSFIHKEDNDRLYILSLKIAELIPFYSFEEIEKATELSKELIEKKQLVISENKLNRNEKIDILIGYFSACEYQTEVASILAMKTTYNMSSDLYGKYFEPCVNNQIMDFIENALLSSDDIKNEDIAWECILDTLGFEYAYDIIENNLYYRRSYLSSFSIIEQVSDIVLEEFAKMSDRFGNKIQTNNYLSGNTLYNQNKRNFLTSINEVTPSK